MLPLLLTFIFFFLNDTATTEISTLSLHDALPISPSPPTGTVGRGLRPRQPLALQTVMYGPANVPPCWRGLRPRQHGGTLAGPYITVCSARGWRGRRPRPTVPVGGDGEIGRASCRERVEISVVAVSFKKKKMNVR